MSIEYAPNVFLPCAISDFVIAPVVAACSVPGVLAVEELVTARFLTAGVHQTLKILEAVNISDEPSEQEAEMHSSNLE